MTRIVAGAAGGRRLAVPPRGTRPTSDRVREALFSSLQARLDFDGLHVLDLYAGSGALGLEALSRGARYVTFVESDAKASATIAANIAAVSAALASSGGTENLRGTVDSVLGRPPARDYDLILLDPPYDVPTSTVDRQLTLLAPWAAADALVVVERSTRSQPLTWPDWATDVRSKRYGETQIDTASVSSS